MSRTILFLGILILVACVTAAKKGKKDCSENEEYSKCGPTCPETCENIGKECGGKCKSGCFCLKGYIRDKKGQCVKASKKCCTIKNEMFSKCAPNCEATCADPTKKCLGCEMKCVCKPGHVRTPKGKCVKIDTCPPWACPRDNEIFMTCGKPKECLPSCSNLNPADICASVCERGCFCTSGYVRDSEGFCIKPETCPTLVECTVNIPRK